MRYSIFIKKRSSGHQAGTKNFRSKNKFRSRLSTRDANLVVVTGFERRKNRAPIRNKQANKCKAGDEGHPSAFFPSMAIPSALDSFLEQKLKVWRRHSSQQPPQPPHSGSVSNQRKSHLSGHKQYRADNYTATWLPSPTITVLHVRRARRVAGARWDEKTFGASRWDNRFRGIKPKSKTPAGFHETLRELRVFPCVAFSVVQIDKPIHDAEMFRGIGTHETRN